MKNVHLLPTDKPSRLFKDNSQALNLHTHPVMKGMFTNGIGSNQHIYITSDEKLPYNSDIFHTGAFYHRDAAGDVHIINKDTHYPNPNFCSRIILTTDESLFKYGVQAIDDELLEWFVKNPSCEEVKIESWQTKGEWDLDYKIIIPKEEPNYNMKEEIFWISNNPQCKQIETCYNSLSKKCICPKEQQETLEEAADKFSKELSQVVAFHMGAKWQQEQEKNKYSEEEVLDILFKHTEDMFKGTRLTLTEWFEVFKK